MRHDVCGTVRPAGRTQGFWQARKNRCPGIEQHVHGRLELTGLDCDVAALAQGKEKTQADSSPAY
eukprot:15013347-Alexandrium_andersonii.AAC.1